METDIVKELPVRPKIRISYYVIPMSDNRVQLRSGSDAFLLHGETVHKLIQQLFPLLDGQHSVQDILRKMEGYPQETIFNFLSRLTQRRVIEDAALEPLQPVSKQELDCHVPQLTYFSHYSANPYEQQAKLRQATVTVCGLGPLGSRLAVSLARAGVGKIMGLDDAQVTEADVHQGVIFAAKDLGQARAKSLAENQAGMSYTCWEGIECKVEFPDDLVPYLQQVDYLAVCLESPNPLLLERINQACLDIGLTWTWCALDGHIATIGPTVIPRELACWKCYDLRVKANIDHYEEYLAYDNHLRQKAEQQVSFGYLTPALDMLAGFTATEIIKDISGLTPPTTYGAQISFDMLTTEFDLHPVLKLPRCPVCSRLKDHGAMIRPFLERE